MGEESNSLLFIQIVVAIAAVVCTGVVIRKIISFHAQLVVATIVFVGFVAAFTYLSVVIPLSLFSGSEKKQLDLTVDLMMFSSIALVLIGIISFAIDHLLERPTFLVIAAAAILSIGIAPFLYSIQRDEFNSAYKIRIVAPGPVQESPPPATQPGFLQ